MELSKIIRPKTIDEAYQVYTNFQNSIIIGGGAWLKFVSPKADLGIDLSELGINQIIETKDYIEIGAMTSLYQVEQHPSIKALGNGYLSQAIGMILGVPFRDIATIGGSIFGKYAFSDIITPLLCLDVKLNFYKQETMSLEAYLNSKDKLNDILLSILIKKESGKGFFKKVSNTSLDFSIINVAVTYFNQKLCIVVGARPGIAKKAILAMDFANKTKVFDEHSIEEIALAAISELTFGSNHLASDLYRREVAKVYIERGIREVLL
jgi:CO/xanthine dehydrogenase FAD-binding subunit